MSEARTSLIDLHAALSLYAGATRSPASRPVPNDLLWSELPELRAMVDLGFGYGFALLLMAAHVCLRWRLRHAGATVYASLVLLSSSCASQLLARLLSLPAYTVYDGDPLVTLLVSCGLLAFLARAECAATRP